MSGRAPVVPPRHPEALGGIPQIAVDHVPVRVHRHGSCGVSQYSLHHFRISARRQPHRSRRVAQIVNAQLGVAHGAWIADPANNVIGLIQYPGPLVSLADGLSRLRNHTGDTPPCVGDIVAG